MKPRIEMTNEHYQRIFVKADKAMQRRLKARTKAEKERTGYWWALWMSATGIRKFES